MGKIFKEIDPTLIDFIKRQKMFFVATSPLSADGHVNLSPKGLDTFRVLGPQSVSYLDLTGSGVETIAHLKENGRITIMFCAFEGAPRILRLYGRGEVIEPKHPGFSTLRQSFGEHLGVRAIIRVLVSRIADSCGYAVPLYDFVAERDTLTKYSQNKGEEGLCKYRNERNAKSLDGLTGLEPVNGR
ncbi:MAG: pyridoxamine 5'-phosphate oxidase family protein [Bdellovibrionota bacterium]